MRVRRWYRRTIPILSAAGYRVICPDALAFDHLDLARVTLVGQDWGGLIGLRLVAEHPERFSRVVVASTGLPTGDIPMPQIWWRFREAIQGMPKIDVGWFVQGGCRETMSDDVRRGYDAPFPDDTFCAGPRAMPGLLPTTPR